MLKSKKAFWSVKRFYEKREFLSIFLFFLILFHTKYIPCSNIVHLVSNDFVVRLLKG